MKKPVISCDLDDTLFDAVEKFIPFTNKKYKTHFIFDKVRNSDVLNEKIPLNEEVSRWKQFFESKQGMSVKPEQKVRKAIEKLSKDYKLIVVSARDLVLQSSAEMWVNNNFPKMFSKIIFIKRKSKTLSKADVCIKNAVVLHVDDNPRHIVDCLNKKVPCILVNRPWNKDVNLPVRRINNINYKDIIRYLRN